MVTTKQKHLEYFADVAKYWLHFLEGSSITLQLTLHDEQIVISQVTSHVLLPGTTCIHKPG